MGEKKSSRLGTKLTPEQKKNLAEGRKKAKAEREKARNFFEEFGDLVTTAKFWSSVSEELRQGIMTAIKKANSKNLKEDIKTLELLLEQKKKEISEI